MARLQYVIDLLAVAPNQDKDAPKTIEHTCTGDLVHPLLQRRIEALLLRLLIPSSATLLTNAASPLHTDPVVRDEMADQEFSLCQPQGVFRKRLAALLCPSSDRPPAV